MESAGSIVDKLLEVDVAPAALPAVSVPMQEASSRAPKLKVLKDNRTDLTDMERRKVMSRGAVWHPGNKDRPIPAVWKSVVNGRTWYVCNTHRAYQAKRSIAAAINAFKFIKTTA